MDRLGDHYHRAAPRARGALPSLCAQGPRTSADAAARGEGTRRLEVGFGQELHTGAVMERPADLRLDLAHARKVDGDPLADAEVVLTLDAASLVRKVGELDGRGAAVVAVNDRVDGDRLPVLAPYPTMHALHDANPHVSAAPCRIWVKLALNRL